MRYIFLFILIFVRSLTASAQYPPYIPPRPDPNIQREREWREIRSRLDRLNSLGRDMNRQRPVHKAVTEPSVIKIYRESTNEERALLAPENEDKNKYSEFLKQPKTGMIRLVADLGCDELSAKNNGASICGTFSMRGGGSAYSFRQNDYQYWRLADLLYDGKSFIAFGQMSQGFLVNIGDVTLNELTRTTKGLDFAFAFVPENDRSGSERQHKQFADGLLNNKLLYKKFLPVVEHNTYILRSIAFKGVVEREERGFKYNELDLDKREDVIVAFRVVRKDFNGTVTLLWKIYRSKPSPVLDLTNN